MGIEINDFRLSICWASPLLDLLPDPPPAGPLGFLGVLGTYAATFDLATSTAAPGGLERPWSDDKPSTQSFWAKLVKGDKRITVNGQKAMKNLVPFARSLPVTEDIGDDNERVTALLFYYPFAIGLAVTAKVSVPSSLDEMVERATTIRRSEKLLGFVEQELRRAAKQVTRNPELSSLSDPFTVLTVVQGKGAGDAKQAPGEPQQRALYAVTTWDPLWRDVAPLPALESRNLLASGVAANVLYADRRGRALWYPTYFQGAAPPQTSLSDRHTYISLLSLHIEALGRFVSSTPTVGDLWPRHRDWAWKAASLLGRLNGQGQYTFRSPSAHRQIEDNYKAAINAVRTGRFGMPELVP